MQETVLIALTTGVLTGVTALAASWLTSRGNVQAAQAQAEITAINHRQDRTRELRRAAYADFLAYANELHYLAHTVVGHAIAGDQAAVASIRAKRIEIFREFARRKSIVHLEGPTSLEGATLRVDHAFTRLADELTRALDEGPLDGIKDAIRPAARDVTDAAAHFLREARTALETPGVGG
ncbi:hypothetical protein [Virgisporangium aurantiacum]|uniref:Uncharacterized protein n=1 Tax=Virgisporangium aurantiacum TaxID=175570 RepID=A0A8J4E7F5_9ACTN|nr:hypothetical protein [Virgisporangium aurantiacum]GIJ65050.1 hypothetical protein Vau01_125660 [Virgisporangium aurantiacum]